MSHKRNTGPAIKAAKLARDTGKSAYAGGRVRQRINAVRTLIGAGWPVGRITESLAEEWKVHPRTVRSYVQNVREQTRLDFEEAAKTGGIRADLMTQLDSLYSKAEKAGQLRVCMSIIEKKAEWAGLNVKRFEVSGPGGAPLAQTTVNLAGLSDEQFKALGGIIGEKDEE